MGETVTVAAEVAGPRLAVGTVDLYGVRYVRLDHVLQWLEDVVDTEGRVAPAEILATLERVKIGADRG